MTNLKNVKLGFCPIGKFVFSHEDALRYKRLLEDFMKEKKITYTGIDEIIPDGIIRDHSHVEPVVRYFKDENIDALFIPHCNFGTESAAGMIAKELNVPTLLWAPRDEMPLEDGSRLRDSLCGTLATSKVLNKLKVPFTYINNCYITDNEFKNGFTDFMRVANTVKSFYNMRIAQIGIGIDFFWTTIVNQSELLDKFGIQVVPFDMVEFLEDIKQKANENKSKYKEELNKMKSWLDTSNIENQDELLFGLAKRDVMFDIAKSGNFDAFSIQSFNSMPNAIGAGSGLGNVLVEQRYPVAAESDIHGAISSVILKASSVKKQPVFFPEFTVRNPEDDNSILLWHASAPVSLRHESIKKVPFLPPWILKSLPPTSLQFRLKDGGVTVCRFDGETDSYTLGSGQGVIKKGPKTREIYGWMQVNDWPKWERKIIEGPYIHHCSCIYDNSSHVLKEACKYIPELKFEDFDG